MNKVSIEWTHRPETGGAAGGFTWNPIRARYPNAPRVGEHGGIIVRPHSGTFCTKISPGCTHCYAATLNQRFGNGLDYTVPNLEKVEFYIDERMLAEPLNRKKPATIFVADMFDLFHEAIPLSMISQVIDVAVRARQHTFQFLTKRAERMRAAFCQRELEPGAQHEGKRSNIWLGVSVESQKYAEERIPLLLQTPAAVRFLSVEPQLEAINLRNLNIRQHVVPHLSNPDSPHYPEHFPFDCLTGTTPHGDETAAISWVICGGESGPGARPFNLSWAESILDQCRAAKVPFFMKQIGSKPVVHSCRNESCTHPDCGMEDVRTRDRKGGDPEEWPEHLRVREFPQVGQFQNQTKGDPCES